MTRSHSNMLPPSEGSEKVRGQLSVISGWSQDAGFKMHLRINDIGLRRVVEVEGLGVGWWWRERGWSGSLLYGKCK